jgi:hypothetical protein
MIQEDKVTPEEKQENNEQKRVLSELQLSLPMIMVFFCLASEYCCGTDIAKATCIPVDIVKFVLTVVATLSYSYFLICIYHDDLRKLLKTLKEKKKKYQDKNN